MVILEVDVTAEQPEAAAIVFVTVYVPAVLADKSTIPEDALIINPAVELNNPATPPPLNVGDGSTPFEQ